MKAAAARRSATEKAQAEELVTKLEPVVLELHPQIGRGWPSLRLRHIGRYRRASWQRKGFEIDRRKIQLDEPLKSVGEFSVAIRLHREVTLMSRKRAASVAARCAVAYLRSAVTKSIVRLGSR